MTYTEKLSEKEERFEHLRKTSGFFLAPLFALIVYFLHFETLTPDAKRLFVILIFVLTLWLTEALPLSVTAILGAVLSAIFQVAPAKEVFSPFAHPLIFLFIGSFILARAISFHGLDKRFSFLILSVPIFQQSPLALLFGFGLISAFLSMWISNTAATAMLLPIAIGVLHTIKKIEAKENFNYKSYSTSMMIMLAYGASIGGIATPVGTPPNVVAIGMLEKLAGIKIGFFEWMSFALPITLVMLVYLFLILILTGKGFRVKMTGVGDYIEKEKEKLGRLTLGEKNTLFIFLLTVFLWILPSLVRIFVGTESELYLILNKSLNIGAVASFGACLLFMVPVNFKKLEFTLTWSEAVKIDWGTVLLFGGGLSLGSLMFSTGLAEAFGTFLLSFTGVSSMAGLMAIGIIFGIIISETASNTTSANMVLPVMIAMAVSLNVPVLPVALGACLGASFGFMLPVSTPPNAIVFGSGMVPITAMVKRGILFDIGGFIIIFIGLLILCPMLGLM